MAFRTNSNSNFRKQLLCHMYDSFKIGRAMGKGSILLVGSSGVGKSSTVNHLFSINKDCLIEFAKTSQETSETRVTTEYEIDANDLGFEVCHNSPVQKPF